MAAESGRKIAIGIGLEATRGTAVAPAIWTPHDDTDFRQRADSENIESGLGVLDRFSGIEIVKNYGSGNLSGDVGDRSLPYLLALGFGALPTTSDNADSNA